MIEICIIKCRNAGVDCKVHGLTIVGFKKSSYNELKTSVSFLANDWDLTQDHTPAIQYPAAGKPSFICNKRPCRFFSLNFPLTEKTPVEYSTSCSSSSGCKVFVWGLNDKDQLGGMKGSKVKLPVLSEFLSSLRPIHIAGGSKSLFIVSQEGKVKFHVQL